MTDVTLAQLRAANVARQAEWTPDPANQPGLAFRTIELVGEAGETANTVKKLLRERAGWAGSRVGLTALAEELADVVICADLLALTAGLDLGSAVRAKFNATSDKHGFKTRIDAPLERDYPLETLAAKRHEDAKIAIETVRDYLTTPMVCSCGVKSPDPRRHDIACQAAINGRIHRELNRVDDYISTLFERCEALTGQVRNCAIAIADRRRIAELLEANNAYLERTRAAEAEVARLKDIIEGMAAEMPADGACVRCGAAPRNAAGLCATCVDEDAERLS